MTGTAASLAALLSMSLSVQPVPEGIHREGNGRADLCGEEAATVADLHRQLVGRLEALPGNERYTALSDNVNLRIWTFTTDRHPAHPAVACRTVSTDEAGNVRLRMEIMCHNARERCDALYREFEALNAQMSAQD